MKDKLIFGTHGNQETIKKIYIYIKLVEVLLSMRFESPQLR